MALRRIPHFSLLFLFLLLVVSPGGPAQESPGPEKEPNQAVSTFVVPIHGNIEPPLVAFLQRSVEEAKAAGVETIVFDVDTFGGRVDSALQITTLIGSLDDIRTVAYVTLSPEGSGVSWSAGALISFAADAIYMAPGTSMGSAAPVIAAPGSEPEAASEKTVSAVRTQMAALAEKNGHPKGVALAMVDTAVELVEISRNGVIDTITRAELDAISEEEREAQGIEIGPVVSADGKLLSLTAGEMERYGVSSGTVSDYEGLYELLGTTEREVRRLEPDSADDLVAFLTSGAVTSLLVLVGLVALFLEVTSPGFGIPGAVALVAFATLFTANSLLGRVGSVELLLFVVGVVLLVLELFVIPGFGVAGISGFVAIGVSLVLSLQTFVVPSVPGEWQQFHRNLLIVGINAVVALVGFFALANALGRSRLFRNLTLFSTQEATAGFTAQDVDSAARLVGREGTAVTTLRPVGKGRFDDEILVVETQGEYLTAGEGIRIIAADGNRVVVTRRS
ncbi:MAG: NfeD family protein [Spirochaetota bacterium]